MDFCSITVYNNIDKSWLAEKGSVLRTGGAGALWKGAVTVPFHMQFGISHRIWIALYAYGFIKHQDQRGEICSLPRRKQEGHLQI